MNKKIISAVLLLTLVTALFSGCSKKTATKLTYNVTENNTVEIISYTDLTTVSQIEIPDEIDGMPVTRVCDFGVVNAETLEKITIGKNVSEIGEWAFTNNQGLREFAVSPDNEYFTAVDGVLYTKDMKTLLFYPPARNIEFDKLKQNQNTTEYVIPDGVELIRSKAFYKCYYVSAITIPESVTAIGEKAFHRTAALESITLPSGLETIGKDAFAYCAKLETVVIPASVTEIDEYAFYNCTSLKSVTMLCSESAVMLGKKWYPTNNGREIKELVVEWK